MSIEVAPSESCPLWFPLLFCSPEGCWQMEFAENQAVNTLPRKTFFFLPIFPSMLAVPSLLRVLTVALHSTLPLSCFLCLESPLISRVNMSVVVLRNLLQKR